VRKLYYLSTCDTCKRIIDELQLKKKGFEFQDIKTEKISSKQLEEMKALSGSYESLFSRVALKYKTLDPRPATEAEYKKLILQEYTFLKRPVMLANGKIFVGNSKSTVAAAEEALSS
jgi:arsenate reductase